MALTDRSRNWKDRPCHFTWKLNTGNRVNYEKIVRNIDSDLEITTNLFTTGKLLFRAYLEVSNRYYHYDVRKAREFLDRADDYICNHAPPDFRNGFKSVALLNRMWIEQKNLNYRKVNSLLADLNKLDLTEKDMHVINTVKASGLTRLGPPEMDNALSIFEAALKHFPNCPDFLFGAMLVVGRKMRYNMKLTANYDQLDELGRSLMDKERCYCEKLVLNGKDEYQLGRSFLGQNFKRRGPKYHDSARFHLEKAFNLAPNVRANFNNLIRFYRYYDEEKAIRTLIGNIETSPYARVAESHFQLALCYIRKLQGNYPLHDTISNQTYIDKAIYELDKCLKLDEMHLFALTTKLDLLTKCGQTQQAQQLYEDNLQQSENLTPEDRVHFFYCYANFLDKTKSPDRIDTWQRVMEISTQLQFQDQSCGEWKVPDKIKRNRDKAYEILLTHYKYMCQQEINVDLELGFLYLQKCEFAKAAEVLSRLDPRSNVEIPMYLAQVRFKWGCEVQVRAHLGLGQPDQATQLFRMARENVVAASKMRHFDETQGRKLLAGIALWTAHNQLSSAGLKIPHQSLSAQPESLRGSCLGAYHEAVRCGSLVASSELLRLIQKCHLKTVARSEYIKILAEVDICCSRDASSCLHTEYKPLTFEGGLSSRDTDSDQMGIECDMIKQHVTDILGQEEFFSDTRREYFDMERQILQEDPRSTSITLMLSEEGGGSVQWSEGVVKAAVDCCEKARPLLDHIVVKFQMEELKFSEERKKQYFPLKKEADQAKLEKELTKSLKSTFEVDLRTHYPKLYNYILKIQPGINPEYECLLSLCEVVGQSKHASRRAENLRSVVEDPVQVARHSIDRVEEICNVFFRTMKDSTDLESKVSELVADLRSGGHEKAEELLTILADNADFVCRIGSTWKLLEMLALVQRSRTRSGRLSGDLDGVWVKLAEGAWDLSKKLRRAHLDVEVALLETADPSSSEVLEKCRSTCKEADDLLKTVMETKKKNRQDGKAVEFPFKDLHPGVDSLTAQGSRHWEGRVDKQLRIEIKRMGVTPDDNLIKSILKLQPCTDEKNYQFLAMRQLARRSDGVDAIMDTASVQTAIPDAREYRVVDLVRFCTDNAVKIAAEINELTPKGPC